MDQRRRVRDAYDNIAVDYNAQRSNSEPGLFEDLDARLDADSRVLDAGCGDGRVGLGDLDADHRTVGVDFSGEQLGIAADASRGDALVRGDITQLAFVDNTFDAITCLYAIIHVPTEEHPTVLEEFARVCRPGGWLLFTAGGEAWRGANDDWLETGVRMEWSFPDTKTTIETLVDMGFAVVSVREANDELGGSFPVILAQR